MKTIRVLTIGNSFSQNALTFLEEIARDAGKVVFEIGRASLGGCSLEKHWNLATYTERVPEYKTYSIERPANGSAVELNLQEALAWKPWDFVTLQQVSKQSWRRETFEPYLSRLQGLVRSLAPQAEIMLHQTWAYRSDSPFLPENGITQEIMHRRISENYRHFSSTTGCRVIPAGEAVHRARQAEGRRFTWPDPTFDYQSSDAAPRLPAQSHSLAVGWHWRINNTPDGIPALALDANHLNDAGCFLAGCVWYETLTGLDVTESTFVPAGMDPETAAFLRSVAHATVTAAAVGA